MRRIFAVSFALLFSSLLSAQSFRAGLRGGLAGTQVNGDRLTGYNKGGLIFGGFVNRKLTEHLSAQFEIIYIQKGSRKPTSEIDNSYYLLRVNYIEVPLMLQWFMNKKIGIAAGPSFGSLLSSHEENEWGEFNSGGSFKKFELSANAGLIYRFSDHFMFDARYSASMTTIRPFPGQTTAFFDRGQYNIVLQFCLLYAF